MTRLTLPHYGGKGHYMKCSERFGCDGNCGDCDSLDEIVEKLARYEDEEERKPQTNADRIRAMSDEELAWELMTWRIETCARLNGAESPYPNTQKTILEWLQQPVKDGDNT